MAYNDLPLDPQLVLGILFGKHMVDIGIEEEVTGFLAFISLENLQGILSIFDIFSL